jgi:uncharacterized cysteine cluster protein YcgN (CxxCxxCC family)
VKLWWQKRLAELDSQQWEALCDGCGKCCLHKLEDEDTGAVSYTRVRCRYLDDTTCQCLDYANRAHLVPDCVQLSPENLEALAWLPATCAYRLRAEDRELPAWHYLVSGSRESVHEAGESIRGRALSDEYVHPDGFQEHVVHWVK